MALTPSTMLPLGSKSPRLPPPRPTEPRFRWRTPRGAPAILVIFLSQPLPLCQDTFAMNWRHLGREYQAKGVAVFGISSR